MTTEHLHCTSTKTQSEGVPEATLTVEVAPADSATADSSTAPVPKAALADLEENLEKVHEHLHLYD